MDRPLIEGFLKSGFTELPLPEVFSSRFDLMERVGHNDFGETFLVSEKETKDLYILKSQFNPETVTGNEARILKGLRHKGLPNYEDPVENGGTCYTLRKYVEGEPLDIFLAEHSEINISRAVDILISLCDILIFLHSQPDPIIHRDIKPSNIIIDSENNSVVLIDFGISRRFREGTENDTAYFGTRKFAPPEQYGFAQTDCRTDIYSFGVVMRYLLTGTTDVSARIQDNRLENIAKKCTEIAPRSRYQSVSALKKALLGYKHRVRRVLTAAAAVAVLALTAFLAIFTLFPLSDNVSDDMPRIYQTPVGYDDTEYQRLVSFFLYEDNLEKILAQHDGFIIENPATWYWERGGTYIADDGLEHPLINFLSWERGHVAYIHLSDLGLTGDFDVSGFEQLVVLDVARNDLTSVSISGCISLVELYVDRDILAALDLSDLPSLEFVN